MSRWDGRSRGSILGYKIFIFLLKYVHIRVAYFVLQFVVFYFLIFSNKRYIYHFYRKILNYSALKTEFAIYKNYLSLGKTIIDKVAVLAGFSQKFTYDFEGEDYLHQISEAGKGGIFIGAHSGNYEIAGFLLKRIKRPVHVIMFDGERTNIKEIIENVTGGKRFNVIYVQPNDISHIYKIKEALSNGDLIAIHGDRYIEESKSFECDFFGSKARFPLGPYYMAAQFGVPVSFVSTMKETDTHYHFYATPPIMIEGTNKKETIKSIQKTAQLYASELEKMIRKYPLQWFNYHDFWQITQ
jgi:predicted LPLAT superfamily acyltransferase